MKWYKASYDLTKDSALHIVASQTRCFRHEVIAVWILLLETAGKENNGGDLGNIKFDELDYALELIGGKSEKIFNALVAREKIIDNKIVNWAKHQADSTNADRQKRFRERHKNNNSNVTPPLPPVTLSQSNAVTVEEKRREENNKKTSKKEVFGSFDILFFVDKGFKQDWQKQFPLPDGNHRDIKFYADIFNENVNSKKLQKPIKPCAAFEGWTKTYLGMKDDADERRTAIY